MKMSNIKKTVMADTMISKWQNIPQYNRFSFFIFSFLSYKAIQFLLSVTAVLVSLDIHAQHKIKGKEGIFRTNSAGILQLAFYLFVLLSILVSILHRRLFCYIEPSCQHHVHNYYYACWMDAEEGSRLNLSVRIFPSRWAID